MTTAGANPPATKDTSSHYHLFVGRPADLDLPAAQAGLEALAFHTRLEFDAAAGQLRVHWQPDALVHPEYAPAQTFAQPPVQVIELPLAPLSAGLQAQIAQALTDEDEDVPPLLQAQPLVMHVVVHAEPDPTSRDALLWSLLGELAATAPDPARMVLFDPEWVCCVPAHEAREYMAWQDMVAYIEEQKALGAQASRPDAVYVEAAAEEEDFPIDIVRAPPGEQVGRGSTATAIAIVAVVALAAAGWFWLRG